jgi:ketosteroid isomerase-like protein
MGVAREVYERAVEAFNQHDLGALESLATQDCVLVRPTREAYKGWNAATEWFEMFWKAFPDCALTVSRYVEEGDQVAVQLTWTGTHSGPLPLPDGSSLEPTGQRVEGLLADFVAVRDGKFASSEVYEGNALEVLTQLGAIPQ